MGPRLSCTKNSFEVDYRGTLNHQTSRYKYLGNTINPSLNFNDDFQVKYKKASGRLRLLAKVRPSLNQKSAEQIYGMMVTPLLTYCSLLNLKLTETQKKMLKSIEKRASRLVNKPVNSFETEIKKCCLQVKKCLDKNTCSPFKTYFQVNEHSMNTRNRNLLLKLPKVKLEFGKCSFKFMGAKLYNQLPISTREEISFSKFKSKLVF